MARRSTTRDKTKSPPGPKPGKKPEKGPGIIRPPLVNDDFTVVKLPDDDELPDGVVKTIIRPPL